MRRTNIYLAESQTEQLDRLAHQRGLSRAELTRQMLSRALAGHDHDLQADLTAIDVSFGACHDLDEPDRAGDEREAHLSRMWRLTA